MPAQSRKHGTPCDRIPNGGGRMNNEHVIEPELLQPAPRRIRARLWDTIR